MHTAERLRQALARRILVFDGAMGTMIQAHGLSEDDFRGQELAGHARPLVGCNDVLSVTRPDIIADIHRGFLAAGADIIETNSFTATSVALADYGLEDRVADINRAAARVARLAADEFTGKTPDRPRFVAGSIGPTTKTASLSSDVNDPGARSVTFVELAQAYRAQARGAARGRRRSAPDRDRTSTRST